MSKSLLFVDDSVTMQTVAEITFRSSDWEYTGARTAAEARAEASGKSLILVDAVMPDGSGYDLAKELKSANSDAIVVMVCGNSEAYNESKGGDAGVDGHIVKPWQTDKVVEQLAEIAGAGPSKAAPALAPAPAPAPAPAAVAAPSAPAPAAKSEPAPAQPRSATLMGMPTLEMPPPVKPLPAGVAAIKTSKPAIPDLKPAPVRTPPPPVAAVATPAPAPAAKAAAPARAPMISQTPGKPIRLVLASQAEALAKQTAQAGGLDSAQADALSSVSRELLEQIIWEVVPDLAETIIRDNLDTLTAKAR